MILNPVIQGGGTLPEKVNIRYSGVIIHYMSESETSDLEINNTTNTQSGTRSICWLSNIYQWKSQRSSGIEKSMLEVLELVTAYSKVIGEGEAFGDSGGGGMG